MVIKVILEIENKWMSVIYPKSTLEDEKLSKEVYTDIPKGVPLTPFLFTKIVSSDKLSKLLCWFDFNLAE